MMFRKIESAARRLYRKQKRPFPKGKKNGIWQNCRLKNWPLSVWAMDRAHPFAAVGDRSDPSTIFDA